MRTFIPYFLRWAVSHASLIYRCAVFPLSRNSGCTGARGSNAQYSFNYGAWGWGLLLLFSLAGFCTAYVAREFAPLRNDYTSSSLRFQGSYLCAFLADPLPLEFLPRAEELYEPRSRRGRGESDWTGLRS